MKRNFIVIVVSLVTVIILSVFPQAQVFANDGKVETDTLVQHWLRNGYPEYPDDIGGVYIDSNTVSDVCYTIVVVHLNEKRADEIRNMVTDPGRIRFVNGKYSYKELVEVMKKIEVDLSGNHDIYSVGIDEMSNHVRVSVDVAVMEEMELNYQKLFGDMVYVQEGKPEKLILSEEGAMVVPGRDNDGSFSTEHEILKWLICFSALSIFMFLFIIWYLRSRKKLAIQMTDGEVLTIEVVSKKEAISLIKGSNIVPDQHNIQSLRSKIRNNQ
jgi:hypothetical protein